MVEFATSAIGGARSGLIFRHFRFWHGSCSAYGRTICQLERAMEAQENQTALPLRSHTILGVCEAIGEDFGFNPVFLRIPLAASVIWNLPIALAVYFGLGLVVLASRLLFPKPNASTAIENVAEPAAVNAQPDLAKAA
ncbi:MAG TPA: hypothetical protein VFW35_11405 [Sphingomicrobium sp.]|nr:hypothetical protein [Sphingomicrobium sp.]